MPAKKRKKRSNASASASAALAAARPVNQGEPFPGRYVILVIGMVLVVMAVLRADAFLYFFAEDPGPPWITACLGMSLVFFAVADLVAEHSSDILGVCLGLALLKLLIFLGWLLFG